MPTERILVVGAGGQLGSVLVPALRERYGDDAVIASDLYIDQAAEDDGFIELDATDATALTATIGKHNITQIYHLAAILSAKGEANPLRTWGVNMETFFNVLEAARRLDVSRVFYPSSIAVFGPNAPHEHTPQNAALQPTTVYGMSKVAGENWANYYYQRYGLDTRSLRYPGIIGYQSMPGGGTTDYAVDIFHRAVKGEDFTCFLRPDSRLPMIYMDDAIRATIELMEAPADHIRVRTSYNLAGLSFTPAEITACIQEFYPDFRTDYQPDFRQEIADSWPDTIDDSVARTDWGWQPEYDLPALCQAMITNLRQQTAQLSNY
jgi:nucleoside-diphosphate-sugar epimerase